MLESQYAEIEAGDAAVQRQADARDNARPMPWRLPAERRIAGGQQIPLHDLPRADDSDRRKTLLSFGLGEPASQCGGELRRERIVVVEVACHDALDACSQITPQPVERSEIALRVQGVDETVFPPAHQRAQPGEAIRRQLA